MKTLRITVSSIPKELTPIEEYALIESYMFMKNALHFPNIFTDITFVEYLFLVRAYEVYYSDHHEGIYSDQFEKGMKSVDKVGEMNVRE